MKKVLNIKVLFVAVLIGYLAVTLITTQFELVNKRQQLEILEQQKARVQLEVDDVQYILDYETEEEYVERIARQRLGYANPDEKVFKDIQGD
ncbi:MAG: septum formation initiator family protein [Oscillospiraceae bacterium]|nr:septum formation initiator family protein [Oscillospiraceae bacterium]